MSVAELHEQLVRSRAVEATIWGMPAVSMAAVRRSLKRDLDAEYVDVIYLSDVMQPRHEFLTANHETPYVLTFFDLVNGPMVLDVPSASDKAMLFGSAIDSWEAPLADIGATGDDKGRGGRYLFLPPDHESEPPSGYIVVPSPTLLRPRRAATDRPRCRYPSRRGRVQPTTTHLRTERCRRSTPEPLHRRLPACLADPADVRSRLPHTARPGHRGGTTTRHRRRDARRAVKPRHRQGRRLRPGRGTGQAARRRREGGCGVDERLLHERRVRTALAEQPVAGNQARQQLRVLIARRRQARLRPSRWRVHVLGNMGTQATRRSKQAPHVLLPQDVPRRRRRTVRRRRRVSGTRARRHPRPRLLVDRRIRGRHQRIHPQPRQPRRRLLLRQRQPDNQRRRISRHLHWTRDARRQGSQLDTHRRQGEPVSCGPAPDDIRLHEWCRDWLAGQWAEWQPRMPASS